MSHEFTTKAGTVLPISSIKGKDYLEVKYRLVWFREERPEWSIETEIVSSTATSAMAKATIRDVNGRVLATAHKTEDKQGFSDFLEKAETGSIGRALALLGYGTQFCGEEMDEGKRIVDSPVGYDQSEPKRDYDREPPRQVTFKPNPHAARNNQPHPDDGDGNSARGFARPKIAAKVETNQRKALGLAINEQRKRLGWSAEDLGTYILDNFNKQGGELTDDEMDILIQALTRKEMSA